METYKIHGLTPQAHIRVGLRQAKVSRPPKSVDLDCADRLMTPASANLSFSYGNLGSVRTP